MNYIYSALLLHSAKKDITEENIKKVISAVETPDESKVKAMVAALEGVNIEEVISKAAMPAAVAAAPAAGGAAAAEKKEDKPSEEEAERKAEEAAQGLSALFG